MNDRFACEEAIFMTCLKISQVKRRIGIWCAFYASILLVCGVLFSRICDWCILVETGLKVLSCPGITVPGWTTIMTMRAKNIGVASSAS
jgi:hypothetical protein